MSNETESTGATADATGHEAALHLFQIAGWGERVWR